MARDYDCHRQDQSGGILANFANSALSVAPSILPWSNSIYLWAKGGSFYLSSGLLSRSGSLAMFTAILSAASKVGVCV